MDKGLTLGASIPIKEKHNAFARSQMFAVDPVEAKEGDDVFHFVAYVPFMVTMQLGMSTVETNICLLIVSFSTNFSYKKMVIKTGSNVFIVIVKGRIYELDGLREGPVDLGVDITEGHNWLVPVKEALMSRIASFPAQEIRFNLMAIVTDRKMVYEGRINECEEQKDTAALKMGAFKYSILSLYEHQGNVTSKFVRIMRNFVLP